MDKSRCLDQLMLFGQSQIPLQLDGNPLSNNAQSIGLPISQCSARLMADAAQRPKYLTVGQGDRSG